MEYKTKVGESIFDVCLNSTGTLQNINTILDYNEFDNWNPEITAGQTILIPDTIPIQTNVRNELQLRPAVNGQITTFQSQLDIILDILNFDMKYFEDGFQFLFEDGKSYKFN
jgi:hypothetical protein